MFGVGTEPQRGVVREMQVDVALEMNCAGEEDPAWHDDPAAARLIAGCDRFPDSRGAVLLAVAGSAEARDVEIAIRKDWRLDAGQNRVRAPLRKRRSRCSNGGRNQKGPARRESRTGAVKSVKLNHCLSITKRCLER